MQEGRSSSFPGMFSPPPTPCVPSWLFKLMSCQAIQRTEKLEVWRQISGIRGEGTGEGRISRRFSPQAPLHPPFAQPSSHQPCIILPPFPKGFYSSNRQGTSQDNETGLDSLIPS
ncbi:hypothetical protein DR999_PMT11576 [Platysternon megacephalum]|uniref:Uncharacterized protein n=1 Tax=Platysternon megacephalum TaxID=55544 RepID=A0A4D9E7K0_9SAUR|nr:hypothetical protein DR999_PMT11576 [Platysternon megacephalum]